MRFDTRPTEKDPKVLRQTFLKFPTVASLAVPVPQICQVESSQPAPAVPAEVWMQILPGLPTIALKSVRLVCKAWSSVATPELFRVVYLDNFNLSWARLRQLSKSSYASLVEKIIWTPLYLSKRCLNADVWSSKYPNLLKGLTHYERADLHHIFRSVLRQEFKQIGSGSKHLEHDDLSRFSALVNCRHVLFSDNIDIETRCIDPNVRRRMQRDRQLLNQAAAWGRSLVYNPLLKEEDGERVGIDNMDNMWLLLARLPSTSHLCIATSTDATTPRGFPKNCICPNIQTVRFQIHFYHHTDMILDSDTHEDMPHRLQGLVQFCSGLFANLRSLTLSSVYTDPGSEFSEPYRLKYLDWIREIDSDYASDESAVADDEIEAQTWSENSPRNTEGRRLSQIDEKFDTLPDGLDRHHLDALEAKLTFGIWKMPELREVFLSNFSLNVQSLIGWLANQPQLPKNGIALHLRGHNILHGFAPEVFLQLLDSLNVRLLLDENSKTLYYENDLSGHSTTFFDVTFERMRRMRNLQYVTQFQSGSYEGVSLEDLIWMSDKAPRELSEIMILHAAEQDVAFAPFPVIFTDRPDDVGHYLQGLDERHLQSSSLYYCCIITDREGDARNRTAVFRWVDHPTYCRYEREYGTGRNVQRLVMLLTAQAYSTYDYDSDDYEDHDSLHRQYLIDHGLGEFESINDVDRWNRDQALLAVYEKEFLRLDITEW